MNRTRHFGPLFTDAELILETSPADEVWGYPDNMGAANWYTGPIHRTSGHFHLRSKPRDDVTRSFQVVSVDYLEARRSSLAKHDSGFEHRIEGTPRSFPSISSVIYSILER